MRSKLEAGKAQKKKVVAVGKKGSSTSQLVGGSRGFTEKVGVPAGGQGSQGDIGRGPSLKSELVIGQSYELCCR